MDDNFNESTIEFSIRLTKEFIGENPSQANKKKINKKEVPLSNEDIEERIKHSLTKEIKPNPTSTNPDELVSIILENIYSHEKKDRGKIQKQYQDQKQTEMKIGDLLERYLSEKGREFGWAHSANCLRAIDFIKKKKSGWITLQIKNSDNTENSSSKSVRKKTEILKWHRRNSAKGTYNWEIFPDEKLKKKISEKNFREFALAIFNKNTN